MLSFKPLLAGANLPDRLRACIGATVALAVTGLICAALPPAVPDLAVLVAPLGASAVLVFAVPASPLAQPWPVIGGNTISALIGIAVADVIPHVMLAAGVAVGAAILVMSVLRCLHPPGGAAALTGVIGGSAVQAAGFGFAFVPVAINSALLVAIALIFHRLAGHSYPHRAAPPLPSRFRPEDIDRALADMHEAFDIGREDLDALLSHAERHASARGSSGRPRRAR